MNYGLLGTLEYYIVTTYNSRDESVKATASTLGITA